MWSWCALASRVRVWKRCRPAGAWQHGAGARGQALCGTRLLYCCGWLESQRSAHRGIWGPRNPLQPESVAAHASGARARANETLLPTAAGDCGPCKCSQRALQTQINQCSQAQTAPTLVEGQRGVRHVHQQRPLPRMRVLRTRTRSYLLLHRLQI